MGDPVHSAPAAVAAAPAAGSKPGPWTWVLIFFIVVISNIVGVATGQINGFLQMIKWNLGTVLAIVAIVAIFKATKK
jgi:hypothetical protein